MTQPRLLIIFDYEVLGEETQEVTTDSSLPSEGDPTMSDDAVETTTKLDMETTAAVKDTEEKLTEESIIEEEDASSTVSSVTEMISDEEITTQKVEEKIMEDETTTSASEIETTTPQETETELPLKPAMPRLDTSEEVST